MCSVAKIKASLIFVMRSVAFSFLIGGVVSGCSNHGLFSEQKGHWKVGKPYQIDGRWYTPAEDWNYRAEGIASWYGDEFGGKPTANGEIFNPNALTAAHKTLPLPSVVHVTNLENGRTVVLKVNDRGPFVGDRLIDISRRGARDLGFMKKGTARVRVELLKQESFLLKQQALAATRGGGKVLSSASRDAFDKNVSLSSETAISSGAKIPQKISPPAEHESWVQVGAFSSRENAEAFYNKLSSLHRGHISLSPPGGDSLFRVRLGPFSSLKEAHFLREQLQKSGVSESSLIVKTGIVKTGGAARAVKPSL